ncbi:MAG: hypothetical protein V1745_03295 [Patescibacteria group bacterium]
MYRIGVIVRPKRTDALICRSLAGHFCLEIAQYGVPHAGWPSWILKRLRNAGPWALLGHLGLSFLIKSEQATERLFGKTIWEKLGTRTPQWASLTKTIYKDERSLRNRFKDVDAIIALDAFRLSQSFFRGLSVPYFEVVWGDATKYLGDSSAFWEYAMGNRKTSMVSMIERTAYFQKVAVVLQIPVHTITADESLRSLKVKQAIELSIELPALLEDAMAHLHDNRDAPERKKVINQCYAPTLWTYIMYRIVGLRSLPRYACRPKEIVLKIPTKS